MFIHVHPIQTENSPPVLECAFKECTVEYPFEHNRTFAYLDEDKILKYAAFCSWRCALSAFGPQYMWQA